LTQNFDINGLYELPELRLCNPDRTELCILANPISLKMNLRYNAVSEMTFNIYKDDGITTKDYSLIRKMRLVHVSDMGYFFIYEVLQHYDGGLPYKEVKCYSAEYMLNYKPVNVTFTTAVETTGTIMSRSYKFYDDDEVAKQSTLMDLLFRSFFDWTFEYCSETMDLADKYRTFDDNSVGLYAFLQNYVADSYNCVFIYDIENFVVRAYTLDEITNAAKQSDIYMDFDTLLKSATVDEVSDSVNTVLAVSGADGLTLSSISPTGSNNIYKFDYYLTDDWIGNKYATDETGHTRVYTSDMFNTPNFDPKEDDPSAKVGGRCLFSNYVKYWEAKLKYFIQTANVVGNYGWLVQRKTDLQGQYLRVNTMYQELVSIQEVATNAQTTLQAAEDAKKEAEEQAKQQYENSQKRKKISGWAMLGLGALLLVGVIADIATGGALTGALVTGITTISGGLITATTAGTIAAGVMAGAAMAGAGLAIKGITNIAMATIQGSYPSTITLNCNLAQANKLKTICDEDVATIQGGEGVSSAYIRNVEASAVTNLLNGKATTSDGTTKDDNCTYVAQNKFWCENTWNPSAGYETKYALTPSKSDLEQGCGQYYSLYVLQEKISAIDEEIQAIIAIWSYNNFFSDTERQTLEPFFIQSEFSSDSFARTSTSTITYNTESTDLVVTNYGVMYVSAYRLALSGNQFYFLGNGGKSQEGFVVDPLRFEESTFRSYVSSRDSSYKVQTAYILSYDNGTWGLYRCSGSSSTLKGESVAVPFSLTTSTGIWVNSSNSYSFQNGDYAYVILYDKDIQIIDNNYLAMQLAEQAYEVLDEVCEPTFSYTFDVDNFVLDGEHTSWTEKMGYGIVDNVNKFAGFGTVTTIQLEDNLVVTPYLQEIDIDYDNPSSLSMTFGNKYNLGTEDWVAGTAIGTVATTVNNTSRLTSSSDTLADTSSLANAQTTNNVQNSTSVAVQNALDAAEQTAKKWDDELSKTVNDNIATSVEDANKLITQAKGGYVILHDTNDDGTPDELLVMKESNLTSSTNQLWRWNTAGLACSVTGYDGTYDSAAIYIDPDYIDPETGEHLGAKGVINADYIRAGSIDASKINVINLNASNITTGTLTMGELKDGTTVPLVVRYKDKNTGNYKTVTAIGPDGINASAINTGTLNADFVNITGTLTSVSIESSTINGGKITGASLYVGDSSNHIYINNNTYTESSHNGYYTYTNKGGKKYNYGTISGYGYNAILDIDTPYTSGGVYLYFANGLLVNALWY